MEKLLTPTLVNFGTRIKPFDQLKNSEPVSTIYNFSFDFDNEIIAGVISFHLVPATLSDHGPRIRPFFHFTPQPSYQITPADLDLEQRRKRLEEYLDQYPTDGQPNPTQRSLYLSLKANPHYRHTEEIEALLLGIEAKIDFGDAAVIQSVSGLINRFWGQTGIIDLCYPTNTGPLAANFDYTYPSTEIRNRVILEGVGPGHIVDLGNIPSKLINPISFTFTRSLRMNPLFKLSNLIKVSSPHFF